jgi:transportin-1
MLDSAEFNGQRPLDFMIPKFLQYCESPSSKIRSTALFCLIQFTFIGSQSLYANLDQFIQTLFHLANDPAPVVRKNVCQAIVQLVDVRPDKIAPTMKDIVRYMLISTEDQDEQVALEACEFWLAVAEQPSLRADVEPFLPEIIPRLLKGMVYTEEDIAILGGDEDDHNVIDRPQDINPALEHATSKQHKLNGTNSDRPATPRRADGSDEADDDEDDEDDEYYSDDDDDDEGYSTWNLRKCSAAALDVLSTVYNAHLFEVIKPFLVQNIRNEDWKIREASVLALGAIAEGCMDGVVPHLPELYPYLLSLLQDSKYLVRQISCWTLGRYGKWAAFLPSEEEKILYFHPLMEGVITPFDCNNN